MSERLKALTCCFIGSKEIPDGEETKILSRIDNRLYPLLEFGVCYMGVGGNLGFDHIITNHLLKLRERDFKRIKIIEVLPYPGYRDKWTDADKLSMECIDKQFDKITYIAKEKGQGAYLRRNRHLIDDSRYCFSYCTRPEGATAIAVKYALEHDTKVYNASSFDVHSLLKISRLQ